MWREFGGEVEGYLVVMYMLLLYITNDVPYIIERYSSALLIVNLPHYCKISLPLQMISLHIVDEQPSHFWKDPPYYGVQIT